METQCLLNYDVLSIGQEHRIYLLVKVMGAKEDAKRKPLPLNLSIVIDRSGSMRGEKLEFVKQAVIDLVRRLGDKDRISLVAYDTMVEVLFPPRIVGEKELINHAIRKLRARATTNLSGGWLQGCEFVVDGVDERTINRVLLLSDGLANVGIQDPATLARMSRQKRAEGVTTTTLGVGVDFNEDLLSKMAVEGGGGFYFIDSPDKAPAFFSEELKDLRNVVGQNLTISINVEKPVREIQQLYDYPIYEEGGALFYQLGDIYVAEERHQVFELALLPLEEGEIRLGSIAVSFDAIQGDRVERKKSVFDILLTAVPETDLEVSLPRIDVEKLALLQKAARAREKAVQLADRGHFEKAEAVLESVVKVIIESGIEDQELLAEHNQLVEEAMDIKLGRQRYDAHARKVHSSKVRYSHRHMRYEAMMEDMHMRHKLSRTAIEREGPPPTRIWSAIGAWDMAGDNLTIGSAEENDIVLKDPRVDPRHCRIEKDKLDWYLVDLGSREGTFANSGLVHDRFRLSIGDVLTVGKTLFRFSGSGKPELSPTRETEEKAMYYIKLGQQMEKRGNFPSAIDYYKQTLSLKPRIAHTLYFANNNIGYSLNQIGEYAEGESFSRAAIEINPDRHNAYKNMGVSLEGQGQYVQAADAYLKADEKESSDPRAMRHLKKMLEKHPGVIEQIPGLRMRPNWGQDDEENANNSNGSIGKQKNGSSPKRLTHAVHILKAAGYLALHPGKNEFTRDEVRKQIGVSREKWMSGYVAIFQAIRADHPGGAPKIKKEYRGAFKRIRWGVYELTEYGKDYIQSHDL